MAGATPTKSRGHREVGKYYVLDTRCEDFKVREVKERDEVAEDRLDFSSCEQRAEGG